MVSRRMRVVGILALLAWTVSGVPDRVQEQRAEVAELASERGAASAGGALLAAMGDLRALGGEEAAPIWTLVPGQSCAPPEPVEGYEATLAAVRAARACRALAELPERGTTPRLTLVDGDPYLVIPGPVAWQEGTSVHVENLEAADLEGLRFARRERQVTVTRTLLGDPPEAPEAPSPPSPPEAPSPPDAPDAPDLLSPAPVPPLPATGVPSPGYPVAPLAPVSPVAPAAPLAPLGPGAPAPPAVPALPDLPVVDELVTVHLDEAIRAAEAADEARRDAEARRQEAAAARTEAARAQLEAGALALERQADELDRIATLYGPEARRTGVEVGRTVLQTLRALGELGIVEVELGDARDDLPPEVLFAPATVAWWPPIQAGVEARTGIPLQVGGSPPHAHAILPGHRLAGVPVWSLPTPATEGAFDLLDGGGVLFVLLLVGLLAREYVDFNRAQGRERDRQMARDTILQRLSHELRTPAASVRSLVDALTHPGTTEAERAQFLDLVRSEAERLATGIDRLLQAARGDASVKVDPVPMDLAEWGEAVRARWIARLPELKLSAAHPSPAVADPERLDEAVDALLDNARKYGGPNVVLSVAPGRIAVEDDGEGIPPKDRARVLKKFERVEGRVNDPGGHGLGLWAVGEVARAHDGSLAIEGANRFVITLGTR